MTTAPAWAARSGAIRAAGNSQQITDGPFAEIKELIGRYWMVQAKSFDEVIEWIKRCPAEDGAKLETRRLIDVGDLADMAEDASMVHKRLEDQVRR
jgi:hypothetical protein